MEEPRIRYVRSPEGAIAYQVVGDGPLDLVFIPNWGNNLLIWREQPFIERFLNRLASFSRLIVFDKRGTGLSDPLPRDARPTFEEWIDDVRLVLDAAGSQHAALFGYGAGSPMALLFAAMHPDRTAALVVGDGYARGARAPDYPVGAPVELQPRASKMFMDVVEGDLAILKVWAPSLEGNESFRRWYPRYFALSSSPAQFEAAMVLGWGADTRAALPAIRVPTLVIHRSDDPFIRVGHGRYLAEHIANAKYVEIPGNDHVWYATDQDAMLDEVQVFLTGARSIPEFDRVLATVLFTDIVGSTQRAADLGDRRWRELLDAHEAICRREVERYRGRFVNTTGDGILATFDGPARAIRSVAAIGEAVRGLGVDIRAGLHTGEVELRGSDVGGIGVNIAARVMSEAGPRETIVSSTVKDLVIGSGIEFEDRGSHELKGVPGDWRLYAVAG